VDSLGIVCGSGIELAPLLDQVTEQQPFSDVFDLPVPALDGHARQFVFGYAQQTPIVLQQGRFHFYDGLDYPQVVSPVDAMARWGVKRIIFTNAVGGLQPALAPGQLVAIRTFRLWPCHKWGRGDEPLTTDFIVPDSDHEGSYQWVHGPSYETQAEIRAMQRIGADVVGMSTAPEVMRCHELGLAAAALSCVTNSCCHPQILTHDHVVHAAHQASARLTTLLTHFLASTPA